MKKILLPALFSAIAFTAFAPLSFAQTAAPAAAKAPAFKAHVLNRAEVDALFQHPENVLVIDVRRPDELTSKGGFPVYLSVQNDQVEQSLKWIPKGRTLLVVSNHAARAGKVADLLKDRGFKVAGAAGVQLYEQEGGTLLKVAPPAPKS
ncbi:MAG: rhodanese-like domain-containing protein [Solimonas sp.]